MPSEVHFRDDTKAIEWDQLLVETFQQGEIIPKPRIKWKELFQVYAWLNKPQTVYS